MRSRPFLRLGMRTAYRMCSVQSKQSSDSWASVLTAQEYASLRLGKVDPPFLSIPGESQNDTFSCAGCGSPLFSVEDEVPEESAKGWPTFAQPVAEGVVSTKRSISESSKDVNTDTPAALIGISNSIVQRIAPIEQGADRRAETNKRSLILSLEDCLDKNGQPPKTFGLLQREARGLERRAFQVAGNRLRNKDAAKKVLGERGVALLRDEVRRSARTHRDRPTASGMIGAGYCAACGGFICRIVPSSHGQISYVGNPSSLRR